MYHRPSGSSVYTGRNSFTPSHNASRPTFGGQPSPSTVASLQIGSGMSGALKRTSTYTPLQQPQWSASPKAAPPPPQQQSHQHGSYAKPSGGGNTPLKSASHHRSNSMSGPGTSGAAAPVAPSPARNAAPAPTAAPTGNSAQPYHLSLQLGGMRPDTQPQPFRRGFAAAPNGAQPQQPPHQQQPQQQSTPYNTQSRGTPVRALPLASHSEAMNGGGGGGGKSNAAPAPSPYARANTVTNINNSPAAAAANRPSSSYNLSRGSGSGNNSLNASIGGSGASSAAVAAAAVAAVAASSGLGSARKQQSTSAPRARSLTHGASPTAAAAPAPLQNPYLDGGNARGGNNNVQPTHSSAAAALMSYQQRGMTPYRHPSVASQNSNGVAVLLGASPSAFGSSARPSSSAAFVRQSFPTSSSAQAAAAAAAAASSSSAANVLTEARMMKAANVNQNPNARSPQANGGGYNPFTGGGGNNTSPKSALAKNGKYLNKLPSSSNMNGNGNVGSGNSPTNRPPSSSVGARTTAQQQQWSSVGAFHNGMAAAPPPPSTPAAGRGTGNPLQRTSVGSLISPSPMNGGGGSNAATPNNKQQSQQHLSTGVSAALGASPRSGVRPSSSQSANRESVNGSAGAGAASSTPTAAAAVAASAPAPAVGFIEVGVAEDPNVRWRPTMEDAIVIKYGLGLKSKSGAANGGGKSGGKSKNDKRGFNPNATGSSDFGASMSPAARHNHELKQQHNNRSHDWSKTGPLLGSGKGGGLGLALNTSNLLSLDSARSNASSAGGSDGGSGASSDRSHAADFKSPTGADARAGGGFFAIMDGHGGRAAVDFVKKHLPKSFKSELANNRGPAAALSAAFLSTDSAMARGKQYKESGTTVAAAYVRPRTAAPPSPSAGSGPHASSVGARDLYVANVGDARAVVAVAAPATAASTGVANGLTAQRLTVDHVPSNPDESIRVHQAGGVVLRGRVNGQLAVSRALGDHALKPAGVSGAPHTAHLPLSSAHKFVIVGCDGLWDVMTDTEAVQAVAGMKNATAMADKLVKMAIQRGTTDNVSVMAIRLQDE